MTFFSHLLGNDPAKTALTRMVAEKRVSQTLLFAGPKGVGKFDFALEFAALLMGSLHAPRVLKKTHPDLHILLPEGKTIQHPIESIRSLKAESALPPFEAACSVYIIDEAQAMLPSSSNALLKTLEEPPAHAYFILVSSSSEELLPTIISRSCKISFFPIAQSLIVSYLEKTEGKNEIEAKRIAFVAQGSLSKAIELASSEIGSYRALLIEALSLDLPDNYSRLQKLCLALEEGCEENEDALLKYADVLWEECAAWYRDLHLLSTGGSIESLYHLDALELLKVSLKKPLVPIEKVLERLARARLGAQRHIKLRTALEYFFLNH